MAPLRLLLLAVLLACMQAAASDIGPTTSPNGWWREVTELPGWPANQSLPTTLYSGYVKMTSEDHNAMPPTLTNATSMFMHYFLFLAEETAGPNAPTVVWWNGGPGATSAWGLFVENGPLMLNEESVVGGSNGDASPAQLILNPYRWTKHANLIAFCNPPPVGFSYCEPEGPTGNGKACGTWNDTRVGIVDAEAIRVVITEHFPSLQEHPIFFMGESYAGVYIGETVQWMLSNPVPFAPVLRQLSGVALGDACLGGDVLCGGASGPYPTLLFFYGHGQVSTELWTWLLTQCSLEELNSRTQTQSCSAAIDKIYTAVGGYYAYNLVDQCTSDAFATKTTTALRRPQPVRGNGGVIPIPEVNGYWCPGQVFFDYFDREDVRLATYVPVNSTFFNADDGEGMSYVYNSLTVMPALTALIRNNNPNIHSGLPVRVWAYDGDEDPSVNIFSTQKAWWNYAATEAFPKTKEWSAWLINGSTIVGGYSTEWQNGTLTFVSIRGSGHMVPEYKPASALGMLEAFLKGTPLPPYVPPPPSSKAQDGVRSHRGGRREASVRRRFRQ